MTQVSPLVQVCTKLKKVVERWDGWLVEFLNGERHQELRDIASGLLTVPLKVTNRPELETNFRPTRAFSLCLCSLMTIVSGTQFHIYKPPFVDNRLA